MKAQQVSFRNGSFDNLSQHFQEFFRFLDNFQVLKSPTNNYRSAFVPYFEWTRFKNSSRVLGSSRNTPNIVLVTVLLCTFWTPRITMHWNEDLTSSITTELPTVRNCTATIIMANKRRRIKRKHISTRLIWNFNLTLMIAYHVNTWGERDERRTKSLLVMSLLYLNGCSTCSEWFLWLFGFLMISRWIRNEKEGKYRRKDGWMRVSHLR